MTAGELLLIFGPPAVGKMTVGRAVCARSDFRLFHNHHTIEPLIDVFDHGTPAFNVLNTEFRLRVIQEAAASGTRLVFTYAWAVDLAEDVREVERLIAPYADAGLPISAVELQADLDTRLTRNGGADRIAAKPSKRDLTWSDANVRSTDAAYRMSTSPDRPSAADELLVRMPHLRLDNSGGSADEAAVAILDWLPTAR